MSSAVATLPDSPIATGVATSAVRGWNGMVGGADGSGGRSWRTVETRSMLSAFDTTFRTPTFWASSSTCKEQCLVCISMFGNRPGRGQSVHDGHDLGRE